CPQEIIQLFIFGLIAKIQIVSDSPLTRQSLNVGVWRRQ
ncbi:hypothetical protein D039_5329B, partial [Vibrio parahaemolyticus EKP-028]